MAGNGIDPVVQLATPEEVLTGRPYDDVVGDPRCGHALAVRAGGERVVVTITDRLTSALASASDEALMDAAAAWAETEEFHDTADPDDLADFLKDSAGLARRAESSGKRLYCWICV